MASQSSIVITTTTVLEESPGLAFWYVIVKYITPCLPYIHALFFIFNMDEWVK